MYTQTGLPTKLSLIILFFIAFAGTAFAQSTQSGRVFEFHTRIPIGGAKVENLITHVIVTTDTSGRFTIQANKRDVIAYSALSYKPDTVAVTTLNYKEIFLESTSKQLQDVNINANNVGVNKGALGNAYEYIPPSPLGGHTLLYQTDSGGNTTGGLALVVPGGKDKAAEARKEQAKLEADDKTQLTIKKQFSVDNLKKYVPLEGQEMQNFMLLYTPSLKVFRSRDFDFPLYVNEKYKEFMQMPEEKRKSKSLADLNATPPAN